MCWACWRRRSSGPPSRGSAGRSGFKYFEHSTAPLLTTWHHWFASDALGIVTVAPLLIGLAAAAREPPPRSELIEGGTALAALAAMGALVIGLPQEPWATVVPVALLFPMLLWLAARCRPVFAAAAAFIVTLTIVWTTTFGIGLFGEPSLLPADRILGAQAGILAVSLCAFVLAALFAERRQHERVLTESEARLQEALTAGAVTAFEWDVITGASRRSKNAAQILGFDPKATVHRVRLPGAGPSGRPRALQGAYTRGPSGPLILCAHLPFHASRRPGSLARGNLASRVRRDRDASCSSRG